MSIVMGTLLQNELQLRRIGDAIVGTLLSLLGDCNRMGIGDGRIMLWVSETYL